MNMSFIKLVEPGYTVVLIMYTYFVNITILLLIYFLNSSLFIFLTLGLVTLPSDDKRKPQQTHHEQRDDRPAKESRSQKHNRVSVCVCLHLRFAACFFNLNVIT